MPKRTKAPYIIENNVRKYRELKELSQTELSFKLQTSVFNIRSWEQQLFQPKPKNQKKLIAFFGNKKDLFIYTTPTPDEQETSAGDPE